MEVYAPSEQATPSAGRIASQTAQGVLGAGLLVPLVGDLTARQVGVLAGSLIGLP